MSHLTPDQIVDAIDGTLGPDARAHVASCADCRGRVDQLTAAMRSAASVEVPEPSPLFWQHFSARVRSAVDAEGAPASGWRRWLRWPVMAPLAGLAMVVAVLAVTLPKAVRPLPPEIAEAPAADVLVNDDGWTLVVEALGDLDWETASEAGLIVEPGAVDRVVMDLTVDEQRALTALLQAELRAKS